ncbi:MAG: hypothetical protein ACOX83_00555 [Candidatus Spyradocola sp.]|jgi:hypothetical protein
MRFRLRCARVLPLLVACLLFFGCAAPAEPEALGKISLTARFQDQDGAALSEGKVRVLCRGRSEDHPLEGGMLSLSSLSREEELTLILLDTEGTELGRTTICFATGAVIDASTDAEGASFVTLKPETESVDLLFSLREDGALTCALRL